MKRVLIISPYFPPSNTADMHRVRMSLPYFLQHQWEAEVVMVDEKFSDVVKDDLLLKSLPKGVKIHKVGAFKKEWTSKFGLGSLGIRAFYFYKKYVNELLKRKKFDLIYFSTTEFMVTLLGNYWKKKFCVPFVIDMQDPWHSDYYQDKPKKERPKKYWFSYRMHQYSEPVAMRHVDGLISVATAYIDTLKARYPRICGLPCATITFGAFEQDFRVAAAYPSWQQPPFEAASDSTNLVYIGRAGYDMQQAIALLFTAFKRGLNAEPSIFSSIKFFFIGTSYAPKGEGTKTVYPIAVSQGVEDHVVELTDRIGFYDSLHFLQQADALFIPGSAAPEYTASKIYPYILSRKPLLAIFHENSSAFQILTDCNAGTVVKNDSSEESVCKIYDFLRRSSLGLNQQAEINWEQFEQFTAASMTKRQCELFDQVIDNVRYHGL